MPCALSAILLLLTLRTWSKSSLREILLCNAPPGRWQWLPKVQGRQDRWGRCGAPRYPERFGTMMKSFGQDNVKYQVFGVLFVEREARSDISVWSQRCQFWIQPLSHCWERTGRRLDFCHNLWWPQKFSFVKVFFNLYCIICCWICNDDIRYRSVWVEMLPMRDGHTDKGR